MTDSRIASELLEALTMGDPDARVYSAVLEVLTSEDQIFLLIAEDEDEALAVEIPHELGLAEDEDEGIDMTVLTGLAPVENSDFLAGPLQGCTNSLTATWTLDVGSFDVWVYMGATSALGDVILDYDPTPVLITGPVVLEWEAPENNWTAWRPTLFIQGAELSVSLHIDAETCEIPACSYDDCVGDTRNLHKVVFTSGPTVTAKRQADDGGSIWTATFTAVAGNPFEFGPEVPIIEGFSDTAPTFAVSGLTYDLDGFIYTDGECGTPVYSPIYDPLCPAVVPPPTVPSVPLGCFEPPVNWRRRQFTIPASYIPLWGEVVPQISVHAITADVRNLRVRFYADVDGNGSIEEDPCAYCGDIVISYVPEGTTLVFDGTDQIIYIESAGGVRRRADNLVFQSDGTPFTWPQLTCGFGYVVTIDLPQTAPAPTVDLTLYSRSV